MKIKKVKSFKEIYSHEAVMYVDDRDTNYDLPDVDRTPILIGLKEGYTCYFNDCGIISASSKRDAIMRLNHIQFSK